MVGKLVKMVKPLAIATGGLVVAGQSFGAATDAVAAITTAQTDALAVAAALVAMGVAIWGALFLYRKFFK